MPLLALSIALLCYQAPNGGQPGRLPIMKAHDGVLVLAKTIEILDAPPGVANEGGAPKRESVREWKYVVLERLDTFFGSTPLRFKVAVPAGEVKLANFFAHPPKEGGGYSGPGPMLGLQPGDCSVWPLQRPNENGLYADYGWMLQVPDEHRINPDPLPSFTAPGSDFSLVNGRAGQFIVAGGTGSLQSSQEMPPYDRSLPAGLRYADLLAGMAVRDLKAKVVGLAPRDDLSRLQALRGDIAGGAGFSPLATDAELATWTKDRLVKEWPQDDIAQLNVLAVRLNWGESAFEPQFLALLKKVGRPSLFANVPPISSENYFVECCEGEDYYVACEGFEHMRSNKSRDPRVLKAAAKWLTEIANPGTDTQRAGDIRSCGLTGDILWYLADTSGEKSLTTNWTAPKAPDLLAAKLMAEKLLRK